jgi:hypothetical protein
MGIEQIVFANLKKILALQGIKFGDGIICILVKL